MNETALRLGCFLGALLLMALWETVSPRRDLTQPKPKRWSINLGIVTLNTILLRIIPGLSAYTAAVYAGEKGWGLLRLIPEHPALHFVLGILILDFAVYLQHVLFHFLPVFWRLHRVHHTDLDFDVTTGLRFHPIEILVSMLYKMGVVVLFGIGPWATVVFEIVLNASSQFNHGNVAMPQRLDRSLRLFLVTPDMHRVHHSSLPPETNSNFGFALPWWDRLCGTYRAQPTQGHLGMEIGLKDFRDPGELQFLSLIRLPFVGK